MTRPMLFGILATAVLSLAALPAGADEMEWTNAVSGGFKDAGNWTVTAGAGPPPPGVGDIVNFNEIGTYIVTFK